jgi:hypothetical protein
MNTPGEKFQMSNSAARQPRPDAQIRRCVVPVAAVFHASTAAFWFRLKQVFVKGRFYFVLSFKDAFTARTD